MVIAGLGMYGEPVREERGANRRGQSVSHVQKAIRLAFLGTESGAGNVSRRF